MLFTAGLVAVSLFKSTFSRSTREPTNVASDSVLDGLLPEWCSLNFLKRQDMGGLLSSGLNAEPFVSRAKSMDLVFQRGFLGRIGCFI